MRRFFFAFTVLLFPLYGYGQGIIFETGTFEQVLEKSVSENKPVFIDFYTDWCGPCRKMSSEVFASDNVGAYFNSNFISYKINAEKGEGPQLAERYGVEVYPTMVFVNPDGSPMHVIVGAKDEDAFMSEIRTLGRSARYGGVMKMKEDFDEGANDELFLKDLFKFLPEEDPMKVKVAERYLLSISAGTFASENEDDIYFLGREGGIIYSLQGWNSEVMFRILDLLEEKSTEGGFSQEFNFSFVFPLNLKVGAYMQSAIATGNQTLLEESLRFQSEFRSRLPGSHTSDGDINVFTGRGLFFASPELIQLGFMAYNRLYPESFKQEVVPYMETLMAGNPPGSGKTLLPSDPRTIEAAKGDAYLRNMILYNIGREQDTIMDFLTRIAGYYWSLMPNDAGTKATVAGWLEYTAALNPYNVSGVMNTVPLLVRTGYGDKAIEALRRVIDAHLVFDTTTREVENAKHMITDIINDKI